MLSGSQQPNYRQVSVGSHTKGRMSCGGYDSLLFASGLGVSLPGDIGLMSVPVFAYNVLSYASQQHILTVGLFTAFRVDLLGSSE